MDAAAIMGAAGRGGAKPTFQPRQRASTAGTDAQGKKLTGLNREIFALTGGASAGSTGPTSPQQPAFKNRKKGPGKQVHWEWKPFSSSARPDGLQLKHWAKQGLQWDDYPFARFNKVIKVLEYTNEDYEKLLESPNWSRSDTDLLMMLVRRFDMNFTVVHDRWNGEGKGPSQEHLKERFYFIQRALTTDRGLEDGEKEKTSKQGEGDGEGEKEGETAKDKAEAAAEAERQQRDNVMMTKPYDIEYEIQRKEYLDKAMSRQKGDEAVEQSIVEQARKIEAMLKKRKQDARKRKDDSEKNKPILPPSSGCILRSRMFELPSPDQQETVSQVLQGIGMEVRMAVIETRETFCDLRGDVSTMLEWYKRVSRRKRETATLRERCMELGGVLPSAKAGEGACSGRDNRKRKQPQAAAAPPTVDESQEGSADVKAEVAAALEAKRRRR